VRSEGEVAECRICATWEHCYALPPTPFLAAEPWLLPARAEPPPPWTPVAVRLLMHMAARLPGGAASTVSLQRLLHAACRRLVGSPADTQVGSWKAV